MPKVSASKSIRRLKLQLLFFFCQPPKSRKSTQPTWLLKPSAKSVQFLPIFTNLFKFLRIYSKKPEFLLKNPNFYNCLLGQLNLFAARGYKNFPQKSHETKCPFSSLVFNEIFRTTKWLLRDFFLDRTPKIPYRSTLVYRRWKRLRLVPYLTWRLLLCEGTFKTGKACKSFLERRLSYEDTFGIHRGRKAQTGFELSIRWNKSEFRVRCNLLKKRLLTSEGVPVLSIKSANFVIKRTLKPKIPQLQVILAISSWFYTL